MDIDRSFFPGLSFFDNELIRLDLIPSQLEGVPDSEAKVDAGTDEQRGVVATVSHEPLHESSSLAPPQGCSFRLLTLFCHASKVTHRGYKNYDPRR